MMKKLLLLALCTSLLLFSLSASAQTATIAEADAIRIATDTVHQNTEVSDEDFAALTVTACLNDLGESARDEWTVYYELKAGDRSATAYTVSIDALTGTVVRWDISPDGLEKAKRTAEGYREMDRLQGERGPWITWTQQQRVDFDATYFDGAYRMPDDGDLTLEQATEIAKQYARDTWHMTDEYLDALPVGADLTGGDAETPSIWYIYFFDEAMRAEGDAAATPHVVMIDNPAGTVYDAWLADTVGVG